MPASSNIVNMACWMSSNPQLHNTFASLGKRQGDSYNVSEDCLSILEEILRKLAVEDQTLRTFRRAIGFGQNISKDLIPLLIYVKDDTKICDASKIIDTTIKILVNLTIPVECLLSIDAVSRTDVGRHTIFELNRLLTTSKEAFTDSRSTKAVVDHIKHVVEKDAILDVQQCDSINDCLSLFRNILHIPDDRASYISDCPLARSSMQNEIIWNLFTQSIDKIIIHLLSCPQKMYWGVTMVQLIALMYKDQHVGTLQKLLNLWLETSLSESSEDNESNTSPPDQGSGDSSPIITSDPTSDSSDNGSGKCNDRTYEPANMPNNDAMRAKNNSMDVVRAAHNRSKTLVNLKRIKSTETENSSSSGVSSMCQTDSSISSNSKAPQTPTLSQQGALTTMQSNNEQQTAKIVGPSSQSEVSDCGYVTQVENQESISTSSNDDDQPHQKPVHQKPHTFQKTRYNNQKNRATSTALETKELRRKKLVKRSKTNIINMKGLIHHQPTDEDMSNILKEFTVDFLLKGYGSLVHDLHAQLLSNIQMPIDTSHFFWLITYFLKFATQLELDLEHVSPVLSYEILSYIIFQGVWIYEELEINCLLPNCDLKPCMRRLHLVVTAIREFLQAVETYHKLTHLSEEDRTALDRLEAQILQTQDLKRLFLLLLRQYNPSLQSRQYLQDLIVTNHTYLAFLDNACKSDQRSNDIMEHLKQFATVEIMRQYGLLLEYFKENGEFVNNCVFTMMHHIGGDLEHISTLFQPSILKTFSKIWETDYEICDDWCDLIEYVIHKFINTPRSKHCPLPAAQLVIEEKVNKHVVSTQSKIEKKWTSIDNDDVDENVSAKRRESVSSAAQNSFESSKQKTHAAIIKELLEQNIITPAQYEEYMTHPKENVYPACPQEDGDVRVLREYLYRESEGTEVLTWLQHIAIEACFVKLVLSNQAIKSDFISEPSVYYNALLHLPIPVIPWTFDQSNNLQQPPFIRLLHKLGFYLPVDTGKIFVRIPDFWTPDYLFSIALQLGPVDASKLKFDVSLLDGQMKNESKIDVNDVAVNGVGHRRFSLSEMKQTPSMVRYSPLPNSTEWVQQILQTKVTPTMDSLLQIPSGHVMPMALPEIEPCDSSSKTDRNIVDMDIPLCEDEHVDGDYIEQHSTCETASVASDLTRMCVSDEEEKSFSQDPKNL